MKSFGSAGEERCLYPSRCSIQIKRGITINLKESKGKELLLELAGEADVLLENFAPGAMDRLGLGIDLFLEKNPRLIYASGSGYGLTGPKKDNLAMDLTVQAVSGMMSINGLEKWTPYESRSRGLRFCGWCPSICWDSNCAV